ncbi:pH-response regulator [Paramyrothecium foliicola]|nr:pH-response regulator [Paramyrothecium foliicola]
MGVGTFFRYIGSVLLLTATALLIVASVSAPVANNLAMFRVDIGRQSDAEINFGTFGWCVRGLGEDRCSKSHIGYNVAEIITEVENTNFSDGAESTAKALTNVMVLHPVGAGLFFIAFLLSLGKGVFVSLLATFVTSIGFLVTAVAVICDFVGFNIIRRRIRRDSNMNSSGHFSTAAWCVLAAAVLALIATIFVFLTCCAGRRESKRHQNRKMESYHDGPAPVTTHRRRHFWQRRSAY